MEQTLQTLTGQQAHEQIAPLHQLASSTFFEIGTKLIIVRDSKYYKELGYSTFADYCEAEWDFKRRNAYNLIDASVVYQNVQRAAQNGCELPKSQRQALALSEAPPEEQAITWETIQSETGKSQPSAPQIKEYFNMGTIEYAEVIDVIDDNYVVSATVVNLTKKEGKALEYVASGQAKSSKELTPLFIECEYNEMDAKRSLSDLVKKGKLEVNGNIGNLKRYTLPTITIHEMPLRDRFEAVKNGAVVHLTVEEKITDEFKTLWEEYGFSERYRLHVVTEGRSPFYNYYTDYEEEYKNYACWTHWVDHKPSIRKEIAEMKKTFILSKHDDHRFVKYAIDKSTK